MVLYFSAFGAVVSHLCTGRRNSIQLSRPCLGDKRLAFDDKLTKDGRLAKRGGRHITQGTVQNT